MSDDLFLLVSQVAGICLGLLIGMAWLSRHYRRIDRRIDWWHERNPVELRGSGPDYWRNPYRGKDWSDVDV